MRAIFFLVAISLVGCSESKNGLDQDYSRPIILDSGINTGDLHLIDWLAPDAYVDPCENVSSLSENFCECKPHCCQNQTWYCPPSGLGVNAAEIVVNICDENFDICDRSSNFSCPPNEIISRGSCNTILECPPGINSEISISVRCEIDGIEGHQEIICSKGNIEYGECIICEPEEERCNFSDDDCDGQIDEGQRNICDSCGIVPSEVCDGIDNDCDGTSDEGLIRECNTICELGLETCSEGLWASCTAKQPVEEICDGLDNDCDSRIDEELQCLCQLQDVGVLSPCSEPPLICGQGFKTCECADQECTEFVMTECSAICSYIPELGEECDRLTGIIMGEECNNFDDDCDNLVDENLLLPCYTGAPETLGVGVCSPGNVICSFGSWGNIREGNFIPGLCIGETVPSREICDGADNDCDGEVDYGDQIRDTDILFIVDWSGSMEDEIEAVRIALNRFSQQFSAEEVIHWGLIVGPKERGVNEEILLKVSDISSFEDFLLRFSNLGNEGMDTGDEMLKDAIYFTLRNISPAAELNIEELSWLRNKNSEPEKENFFISWRPNAERIIIVFSDERPQSFLNPAISTENIVTSLRASVNTKLYAFVGAGVDGDKWDDIILAGRGDRFRLTSNPVSMYNDLMSIIDDACLPREDAQIGKKEKTNFLFKLVNFIEKIFPN